MHKVGLAYFLLFFLVLGRVTTLFAQEQDLLESLPKFQKSVSVLLESGPMITNGTAWGTHINNNLSYSAMDFRLGFRNFKSPIYSTIYRFPTYGFGLYTATFRNPYIGKPNAAYVFADIPFAKRFLDNRLSFSYFASLGISSNLTPFDPDTNPLNFFIGSYQNGYTHIGFTSRYRIWDNMYIDGSIGLKHFSNGSFRKPNSGLNFVPFTIGIRSYLDKVDFENVPKSLPNNFQPHNQINLFTSFGSKNYAIGERQFLKMGVGANILRQVTYKYRVGVGMDMFYSEGSHDRITDAELGFFDANSFAVVGSWEWVLNKNLYVPIAFGTYLNRNNFNDESTWYYQRLGIRYRFNNQIFTGITLKAHGFKADFFEFTLGYTLMKDPNKY
jgi:hypothetical protein